MDEVMAKSFAVCPADQAVIKSVIMFYSLEVIPL